MVYHARLACERCPVQFRMCPLEFFSLGSSEQQRQICEPKWNSWCLCTLCTLGPGSVRRITLTGWCPEAADASAASDELEKISTSTKTVQSRVTRNRDRD